MQVRIVGALLVVLVSGLFIAGWGKTLGEAAKAPAGLSASDWNSIRAEYERNRHAAFQVGGEYRGRNAQQQWLAHFDGRGFIVEPDGDGWRWGLELESYGFARQERLVNGRARVTAEKERISYAWGENVEEWFVNDQRGLEHGFTFGRRPTGGGERLVIHLAVRGGLRSRVLPDRRGVSFVDAEGRAVVQYAGLKVWDADKKALPGRLRESGNGLTMEVEENGAKYPITIDPIAQQAYMKASNTDVEDLFGTSVAVCGDTVVVGAYGEASNARGVNGNQSDNSAPGAGAAYVFVRTGGSWSQQAYLKASNTEGIDIFGRSIAVSGDTVVVGAPQESSHATGVDGNQSDNSAHFAGAAYIFVRNGSVWSQQAYLKASNTNAEHEFGYSVAVSGETVVVGAVGSEDSRSGEAYIFVRNGGVWSQQAYLKASNPAFEDFFGASVAVSADTVVIGALGEDSSATGVNGNQSDNTADESGAVYVFARSSGKWSQQAYLKASNTEAYDGFGASVAVSGDTVVIGASGEDSSATGVNGNQSDNTAEGSGAVYAFARSLGKWSQQAYLKASNTGAEDQFGDSVAVSGNTVVVGAHYEASGAIGVNGNQNDNSAWAAGAAYVFARNGGVWSQQAYLKASNTDFDDHFGSSVAVSGDTVVIGAPGEGSKATGVNGNQSDNSAQWAGAAYAFFINPPCPLTVSLEMKPKVLTPTNQRMVEVNADLEINACVQDPLVKLVSVKSSDPGQGVFPGDLPWDIHGAERGTDDRTFRLRAEAKPPSVDDGGPRRTYTIIYDVTDARARKKRVTSTVRVP